MEGQEKTYKVSAIHPDLKERSRKYFVNYINETYTSDSDDEKKWLGRLAKVEGLFAGQ